MREFHAIGFGFDIQESDGRERVDRAVDIHWGVSSNCPCKVTSRRWSAGNRAERADFAGKLG